MFKITSAMVHIDTKESPLYLLSDEDIYISLGVSYHPDNIDEIVIT